MNSVVVKIAQVLFGIAFTQCKVILYQKVQTFLLRLWICTELIGGFVVYSISARSWKCKPAYSVAGFKPPGAREEYVWWESMRSDKHEVDSDDNALSELIAQCLL